MASIGGGIVVWLALTLRAALGDSDAYWPPAPLVGLCVAVALMIGGSLAPQWMLNQREEEKEEVDNDEDKDDDDSDEDNDNDDDDNNNENNNNDSRRSSESARRADRVRALAAVFATKSEVKAEKLQ